MCLQALPAAQEALGFDVMELEFLTLSNPPTLDESGNEDNSVANNEGDVANVAAVQEELEARVCQRLQTLVLHGGPRLRRSRTSVSIHSIRRSGRLAAKPRVANSTK